MTPTESICKRIDLLRIKSIINDLPPVKKKQPYNFDLPIMEKESKIIKNLIS